VANARGKGIGVVADGGDVNVIDGNFDVDSVGDNNGDGVACNDTVVAVSPGDDDDDDDGAT
jgi:hypothetical protein